MSRLFVAVWPPPEVVDLLSALDRPPVPGVRWSAPEQWAVKLRPLGHVDDRLAGPLAEALAAELVGAPAAACRLGPATRRLGGQWLGAPVHGLEELAAAVFTATEELVPVTTPSRSRPTSSWPGAGCRRSWPAGPWPGRGRPGRCPWSPTARPLARPASRTWPPSRWTARAPRPVGNALGTPGPAAHHGARRTTVGGGP